MKKTIVLLASLISLGTTVYANETTLESELAQLKTQETSLYQKLINRTKENADKDELLAIRAELTNVQSQKILKEKQVNVEKERIAEEKRLAEEARRAELNSSMPKIAFEVTAYFESNNRGPGAVLGELDDGAGQNYGTYSLTQNHTMPGYLKFLSEQYPNLYAKLDGEINSSTFNESWKSLGETDKEEFQNSQAQYLFEKTIMPRMEKFKKDTGIDLLDGTHTVGAVGMFSGMIHNAGMGWYDYLTSAAETAKTENGFDDTIFIKEASGYVANNYNGVYASAIRNRYRNQPTKELVRTDKFFYTATQ